LQSNRGQVEREGRTVTTRLQDQITFRVTSAERVELERLAQAEQRSVAYIARQGVRMVLRQGHTVIEPDEARPYGRRAELNAAALR
jgi:hypothetical protein